MTSSVAISIIMGSTSDYPVMQHAEQVCIDFGIGYEKKIISAHRTPDLLWEYAKSVRERGVKVVIAGAGGAAHLPGMCAALTTLPVIGVPVKSKALNGVDSLYSIVQMPGGIPVATVAINGAKNAALLAVQILALSNNAIATKIQTFRDTQREQVTQAGVVFEAAAGTKSH